MVDNNSQIVELKNISKAFGGVPVLRNVSLSLRPGAIHGIIGGNGAGKSTLMKILSGVYSCDKGEMSLNGQNVKFKHPMRWFDGRKITTRRLIITQYIKI